MAICTLCRAQHRDFDLDWEEFRAWWADDQQLAPEAKRSLGGLCRGCISEFAHYRGRLERKADVYEDYLTEAHLVEWLTMRLRKDAARVQAGEALVKCEALTEHTYHNGNQCHHYASTERDGRRVCGFHVRPKLIKYIDGAATSPERLTIPKDPVLAAALIKAWLDPRVLPTFLQGLA